MIESEEVLRRAAALKAKYGTANPFALARSLHVELLVRELGSLKGFYKDVYGTPFIFLNRHLKRGGNARLCARAGASSAASRICRVRL